ncbi:MAG: alpha/beta fold hydrolase, partial [Nitrospira sp.]|nr:alpha/beta fold hydrolase [Nitrospira sp.]
MQLIGSQKIIQLFLTIIIAWTLSGVSHAQEVLYDYPDLNSYAATVTETPIALRAALPKKIPVKDFELRVFLDHKVPNVLWYDEKLRYSLAAQKGPAPLIFVIAGTGAGYSSEKMTVLQHAFYQAGFHVLSLSSPTHPNFIVSASSTGMPGHLLEDSQDLYRVMRLAWLEHQSDIQVTEFYLTGYSLGAAQAAFVSKLDEEQGDFHFKKVLMINPPVSLYTSTSILDDMLAKNIPGVADTFPEFFDRVFHAFSEVYRKGDFVNFSGDFLYTAYQDREPADEVLAALIGTSFRLSSANMIFTSDVLTNSGYIKPKNLVLSTTDSLTNYYKVSTRVTFLDYFREMFYPFFKIKYPNLTEQSLIENLSLTSLEDYLKHSNKIGLLHNADDFILGEGELDYLLSVFGPRAKIYPRGGHCGNLAHHVTLAYIVEYFNNPVSPTSLQKNQKPFPAFTTPASFRLKEQPLTQSAPVPNVTHSTDDENYPDLRDQLNQQFLVLERRIQESQDSLERTTAMAAASESSRTDSTPPVPSDKIPVAETGIIEPARRPIQEVVYPGKRFVIDVYDPIEGFNRSMYNFNAKFDEYVFLPVVEGYEAIMPDFFEDRLSNFFSNIADLRNLLNSILQ